MIINEMDIQNLSVALVHYVYRNTIIEDYHSKLVHMDENLYKIMHRVVSKNLNFVKQFYSLLKETKKEELITISRTTMPPYKGKEFALFAYSLFGFMNTNYGWDIAQEIEMVDFKNPVDFILGGAFKQACMEHTQLNDETMCHINKDINNRMFTLLMLHYFD